MTNQQSIILGIIQGLTEYLPVSSSAHLVLLPKFLGWQLLEKEAFIFDILVQLGTLLGVTIYFFSDIKSVVSSVLIGIVKKKPLYDENARLGYLVVLASVPAAVIGILFKDQFVSFFSSPKASSYFLIITGLCLVAAEYLSKEVKKNLKGKEAFLIGLAQGLALFPGVSRSGITISAGMSTGLSRKDAAAFSFLMSIPMMLGASMIALLELRNDFSYLSHMSMPLVLGFVSSAISGYLVIKWFMKFLSSHKLIVFACYCFLLGIVGVMLFS